MSNKSDYIYPIVFVFFFLDIIFVILHFFYGQQTTLLNLDLERNIPTFYQGFKLAIISSIVAAILVLIWLSFSSSRLQKFSLIPYWFMFLYLALDEIGEIHESFGGVINRIGGDAITSYREYFTSFNSAQWLLFYAPVMLAGVAYLIYLARHLYRQNTGKMYIFILAVICFALVPIIEYWNTSKIFETYTFNQRNTIIVLEEYFEMLGATLFLAFNLLLLQKNFKKVRLLLANSKNLSI